MIKAKKEKGDMPRGFYLSCERTADGMSIIVGGIISVTDFSDEAVKLASHTGRVAVSGNGLSISVFENKNVEIKGRVKEIKFAYGRT